MTKIIRSCDLPKDQRLDATVYYPCLYMEQDVPRQRMNKYLAFYLSIIILELCNPISCIIRCVVSLCTRDMCLLGRHRRHQELPVDLSKHNIHSMDVLTGTLHWFDWTVRHTFHVHDKRL